MIWHTNHLHNLKTTVAYVPAVSDRPSWCCHVLFRRRGDRRRSALLDVPKQCVSRGEPRTARLAALVRRRPGDPLVPNRRGSTTTMPLPLPRSCRSYRAKTDGLREHIDLALVVQGAVFNQPPDVLPKLKTQATCHIPPPENKFRL